MHIFVISAAQPLIKTVCVSAPEPQLMLTAGPGMIGAGYQAYAPPMPGYQGYGM